MTLGTKILSLVSVLLLFTMAFGVFLISLPVAKTIIFLTSIYMIVVSFRSREKLWLTFFIIVAILFNPLWFISFSKILWQSIDIVVALGFIFYVRRYYDSYGKGDRFEKFVAKLFPKEEWVIEDWTKDKSKSLHRFVESDRYPDLTLRNVLTNKRIAVECKFRSNFWTNQFGTGIFWDKYQHDIYKTYGNKNNIPVYVAFGLGGNPKMPKKLFVVLLSELEVYKGKIIPAQLLGKFEKNTELPISI